MRKKKLKIKLKISLNRSKDISCKMYESKK